MASKTNIQPFVVSFGAENYLLDQDLVRAQSWKNRTIVQLDGTEATESDVVSACETRGYDDLDRVVIVEDAQKLKGDKTLKAYIEDKEPTDGSTVLVGIVRSEKLPDVWALAAKKGRLYEHRKLKTYESNNEVVRWVTSEAMRLELGLDKGVAEALFQFVGSDLYRLSSELRKLQLLLGKGNKATLEHVKRVFAPSPTAEPYQVAEAAVEKDVRKAMNLLSVVYRSMGDEAHVPLAFSLLKQVEKLLVARSLVERKASEEEIATAVGMNVWRCKTYFLPNVKKHSLGSLVSSLGNLRKLDVEVKGSSTSKRTRVELAVLAVAQ